MKKKLAAASLALALTVGGMTVAAAPAQASVGAHCRTVFVNGRIIGYTFTRYYNVFERLFTWKASEQIYVYNGRGCPWQ